MKFKDLIQAKIGETKAKLNPLDAEITKCTKIKIELDEKLEKAKKSISFDDKKQIPEIEAEIAELYAHAERISNLRNNLQLGTNDLTDIYSAVELELVAIRDDNKSHIEAVHQLASELVEKLTEINEIDSKARASIFAEFNKLADYTWDNALSGLKQGNRMNSMMKRIVDPFSGTDDYRITAIIREALKYT